MLSGKAQMVLRRLLDGLGPAEILERHPALKPEYLADVAQEVAVLLGQDVTEQRPRARAERAEARPREDETATSAHKNIWPRMRVAATKLEEARLEYARAYEPWTKKEETELRLMFESGKKVDQIATQLQRKPRAVESRLNRLGLL